MADAKGPTYNPINDLKAILFFFACLWIFWFASGGPARYEASQIKPFIKPPFPLDSGEQYGKLPTASAPQVNLPSGGLPPSNIAVNKKASFGLSGKPVASVSKGQASGSGSAGQAGGSYLKIDFSSVGGNSFDLTGSVVKDLFGSSAVIGGASILPYQGRVNDEMDIILNSRSTIILSEGQSPIGVSFRTNKCIGILSQYQAFYPPLPASSVSGMTYNDCVDTHKYDADFFSNEWRIYLNSNKKIWTEFGDVVRLIDTSGQTITSVIY